MTAAARPGRAERLETFGEGLAGSNLERAGDHNQRVTLHAIRVNGPITRAELAEIIGLTAQTIANITKRLLADGLIVEAGRVQGQRGQPAMRLEINPDGAYAFGLNIDRDHVTLVAVDFLGRVRARAGKEVHFASPETVLAFVQREADKIVKSGAIDPSRLAGVGVAMPDDLARVNLPHRPEDYSVWDEIDVRKLVAQALPGPVHIENDAAAAAMGELQLGHGLRTRSFVYLLISAGLGGGLVVDGAYFRGAHGRSGEIGFLPLQAKSGGSESLQDLVSLAALYHHLEAKGAKASTPGQLLRLDGPARKALDDWLDRAAEALSEPLLVLGCAIDPEAILIGGRLPPDIVDDLCERLNARLAARGRALPATTPVLRAALAADASAMGAAILPFSDRFLPTRSALLKTAEG
jgi:predicted NBD/HSP70 family sugar kinase